MKSGKSKSSAKKTDRKLSATKRIKQQRIHDSVKNHQEMLNHPPLSLADFFSSLSPLMDYKDPITKQQSKEEFSRSYKAERKKLNMKDPLIKKQFREEFINMLKAYQKRRAAAKQADKMHKEEVCVNLAGLTIGL